MKIFETNNIKETRTVEIVRMQEGKLGPAPTDQDTERMLNSTIYRVDVRV